MNDVLKSSKPVNKKAIHFGALDGFRGVLALAVAVFHTGWASNINSTTFFKNGPVILDLFFVFSGFLMFFLYGQRLNTPKDATSFLKRRFARLYPLHIFMAFVFLLFAAARLFAHKTGISVLEEGEILPFQPGSSENFFSFLTHLTLTNSMGLTDSLTFNPPAWTVSVEFFAYFVFLVMFMYKRPTRTWHFGMIALGVAGIYWGLSLVKPNMDITYDLGFFRCLAGFFTGVLTAWSFLKIKAHAKSVKPARNTLLNAAMPTVLEVFSLGLLVCFVIYMPGKLQFFIAPVAFTFALVFAFDGGLISRIMSVRPLLYLAKISYSVYLVHTIFAITINILVERALPQDLITMPWFGDFLLLPYLLAVIGASHLTQRYIEVPGQRWVQNTNFGTFKHGVKKAFV